ncbi:MAG: FadR family transcriptional regulator [Lautropia sp.]|nr:FadR family transcriptional regulator [Lautropia sp.]
MPSPLAGAGRLYRQIAEEIRLRIADSTFAAGSRLPAERDLAHRFAVSRTSVREALIALELGGFVEVRGGSGIYVSNPLPFIRPLFEAVDAGPGPFELLHARWLVEGEIAALAARSIDEPTLARLAEALRVLQSPGASAQARDDADRSFHLGIAEATGNGALIQTVRMYWDQRRGPMWQKLVEHFHTPQLRAVVADDHARILDALAMRAPARARLAMRRHLLCVTREFGKERDTTAGAPTRPRSLRAGMPPPGRLRVCASEDGSARPGDAQQFLVARADGTTKSGFRARVF